MNFVRLARVRFLAIALLLWASVVVARLAELQLAEGGRYRARPAAAGAAHRGLPASRLHLRSRRTAARGFRGSVVRVRDPR